MGRSFESIRLGVRNTSERWMRVRKAMRPGDQVYAQRLADMAKKHSSEGFYAFDDPLEAAVFSVLVELLKEIDRKQDGEPGEPEWNEHAQEGRLCSPVMPLFSK